MSEIINIGEAIIYSSFYVDNPKGVLSIQAASEVIKMINELNEYKEAARSEAEEVNRLQKEINDLRNVTYWTVEQNGNVTRHISIADVEKLQTENKKLKEENIILMAELDDTRKQLEKALV